MQETQFREWLLQRYPGNTASSRLSNCHTVERSEGDLDDHFNKDKGLSLISILKYSAKDQRENRQPKHKIPINGNIYNGTATLKQAVKLYFKFKKEPSLPEPDEIEKLDKDLVQKDKELDNLKIAYEDQSNKLKEVQSQLDAANRQIESFNFFEKAREIAKKITGEDKQFSDMIDKVSFDKHFPGEIKRVLENLLKEMFPQKDARLYTSQTQAGKKIIS